MAKRVVVVPYNEQWKTDFEIIKQHLFPAVKDLIISIEHIGSTSVEGLSAKPIIDIDIVIKDYSVFDTVVERLAILGYIHEGNLGIKDREAFNYKGNMDLPKHHLYVCPQFSEELQRHIAFRDYLKNNSEAVLKYSKVKEEGAKLFPDSIDDYIAYKSPFIEEIYMECKLEGFIKQRDIKVRNDEHLRVIKCFYLYLRSVSGDERLLPSVLEKLLGIDLTNISVVTACFNGVNDDSKPPCDNVDLYIKLNNGVKVFVYGRKQRLPNVPKENEYVIFFISDNLSSNITYIESNQIIV
ncbi:MAG: GrpB family protein [Clostridia bacterium]|nr:GrpB family protein [Clostridia bacterium]